MKINKEKNFVPCGLTSFQAKLTIAVVKEKKKEKKINPLTHTPIIPGRSTSTMR